MDAYIPKDAAAYALMASTACTTGVYCMAAFDASMGRMPGAYVSLLVAAPLGLLATYVPLLFSVIMALVPSTRAAVMLAVSVLSVMAFQAAAVSSTPPVILALSVASLAVFLTAARAQGALSLDTARATAAKRERLAAALRAAI